MIAAGKVTLGDESVDMEYSASFGGSVTFLESDFSKAFSGKAGEKLDYVTFAMNRATVVMNNKTYSLNDGSNAAIFGWAYTTSKATTKLSSTDKCYYQASYTQLDLDEVTYVTGSYRTKYTVYLPYTAVGTSGSRYEGYTAITVSGDDSITASGASMKTLGAADAVLRAYPNAAYVMFKQPAVSEGRLLYNFRLRRRAELHGGRLQQGPVLSQRHEREEPVSRQRLLSPRSGLQHADPARLHGLRHVRHAAGQRRADRARGLEDGLLRLLGRQRADLLVGGERGRLHE